MYLNLKGGKNAPLYIVSLYTVIFWELNPYKERLTTFKSQKFGLTE